MRLLEPGAADGRPEPQAFTHSATVGDASSGPAPGAVVVAVQWLPWVYVVIMILLLVAVTIDCRAARATYRKRAEEWRVPGDCGQAGDLHPNRVTLRKAIDALTSDSSLRLDASAQDALEKGLKA